MKLCCNSGIRMVVLVLGCLLASKLTVAQSVSLLTRPVEPGAARAQANNGAPEVALDARATVSASATPRSAGAPLGSLRVGDLFRPAPPESALRSRAERKDNPASGSSSERPSHSWVGISRFAVPELDLGQLLRTEPTPYALLLGRDEDAVGLPPYAGVRERPLLYISRPHETKLARRVKRLARKKIYREVRRAAKRRWKDQLEEDVSMRYERYERTLIMINSIGKDSPRADEFNVEQTTNEIRDGVFNKEREGEPEIPLLTWGPLTLTDAGNFRFDVGTAAENEPAEGVTVGPEEEKRPLVSTHYYKLNTSLNLHFHPARYRTKGVGVPFLSSYGVEMEIDWLSDVLGRELVTTELELEASYEGEVAAFVNFVIKSRN